MTIIRPHKSYSIKCFLAFFFASVLVVGLVYIFQYNFLVKTRAEVLSLKKQIPAYQTEVATLKNDLYGMLDPVNLQELATEEGFIIDKHPQYVTVKQ